MGQTRRKFDANFREGAVRLVRETGKPIARRPGPGGQAEAAAQVRHPPRPGLLAGPGPGKAGLHAARLNRKWYRDGTEIPTDEGKLYLASVMEAASRRMVGFTLSSHHDAAAAYGALAMAMPCAAARSLR